MWNFLNSENRPPVRTLLVPTVKACVLISALSVLATQWLSAGKFDQRGLSLLAAEGSRGGREPATTGSIARAAAQGKLDPCATPRKP